MNSFALSSWVWIAAAAAAAAALAVGRLRRGSFKPGEAAAQIGRRAVVTQAVRGGTGKVRIADRTWTVRGPDMPKGAVVEVVGTDGPVLLVKAVAHEPLPPAAPPFDDMAPQA